MLFRANLRVQTWSHLPGTVWRGLIFFTTDRPHYHRMPPLSGDNHGWVVSTVRTGCALGHRATTIRACAHLMKTAARYQLQAQGRSFVPGPNKFGGITGRSPGKRPHYGIAGENPACREKSRQTGPDVNAGTVDHLWNMIFRVQRFLWLAQHTLCHECTERMDVLQFLKPNIYLSLTLLHLACPVWATVFSWSFKMLARIWLLLAPLLKKM